MRQRSPVKNSSTSSRASATSFRLQAVGSCTVCAAQFARPSERGTASILSQNSTAAARRSASNMTGFQSARNTRRATRREMEILAYPASDPAGRGTPCAFRDANAGHCVFWIVWPQHQRPPRPPGPPFRGRFGGKSGSSPSRRRAMASSGAAEMPSSILRAGSEPAPCRLCAGTVFGLPRAPLHTPVAKCIKDPVEQARHLRRAPLRTAWPTPSTRASQSDDPGSIASTSPDRRSPARRTRTLPAVAERLSQGIQIRRDLAPVVLERGNDGASATCSGFERRLVGALGKLFPSRPHGQALMRPSLIDTLHVRIFSSIL